MCYVFGVDLGGTRTKLGLADIRRGAVVRSAVFPTPKHSAQELLDCLCTGFHKLTASLPGADVKGVGVSIGSYIFPGTGVLDSTCGFMDLPDHFALGPTIRQRLGLECRVENDALLIGYAEARYGAGRGYDRVLTLTLGTGVGVGFIAGGRLPERGACNHLAGHLMVRRPGEVPCLDDASCYCAVEGCLESTCSGTALEKMARRALGEDMTNQRLFALAQAGEPAAKETIEQYLRFLCRGLDQYVYTFAPDVFVLAGGVANGLSPYLGTISRRVQAAIHSEYRPAFSLARLREEGGILGAASLFSDMLQGG